MIFLYSGSQQAAGKLTALMSLSALKARLKQASKGTTGREGWRERGKGEGKEGGKGREGEKGTWLAPDTATADFSSDHVLSFFCQHSTVSGISPVLCKARFEEQSVMSFSLGITMV